MNVPKPPSKRGRLSNSSRPGKARGKAARAGPAANTALDVNSIYSDDASLSMIHDTVMKGVEGKMKIHDSSFAQAYNEVARDYGGIGEGNMDGSISINQGPAGSMLGGGLGPYSSLDGGVHGSISSGITGITGGGGAGIGGLGRPSRVVNSSVVEGLWDKATECHHPLKLNLLDSMAEDM